MVKSYNAAPMELFRPAKLRMLCNGDWKRECCSLVRCSGHARDAKWTTEQLVQSVATATVAGEAAESSLRTCGVRRPPTQAPQSGPDHCAKATKQSRLINQNRRVFCASLGNPLRDAPHACVASVRRCARMSSPRRTVRNGPSACERCEWCPRDE